MKRALQAILIAGLDSKQQVLDGTKKITIREGHRDYSNGPVMLGCHILNWATMRTITSVRHTIIKEVTKEEMEADGYSSMEKMIIDLSRYYPSINKFSCVTVIKWE